ncbi:MAG: 2-hydroxyacid dehydrogenase [Proteobacteria bacterium]|nr:2-hydroxyacid dehydrogenase [Pseudomonadota bacterium]
MKVAVFSAKIHDIRYLDDANDGCTHSLTYIEARLSHTSMGLADRHDAVIAFVHDQIDSVVLERFSASGVRMVALRCAGYNNVDLEAAKRLGIVVVRVPAYSPHSVAEHTVGLILSLNRKIHRAYAHVREGNFALDGLLGFDLYGKTVGIVGTGSIGQVVVRIMAGFGCKILVTDPSPSSYCVSLGAVYVPFETLAARSDIISLHCPLTPSTRHIIDHDAIVRMRAGVMILNTGRGALIDTSAAIEGLKSRQIGYLGLDVYEEEGGVFYEDMSDQILCDDVLARLLTFPNVLITSHQGFFTHEAMSAIAKTTLLSLTQFKAGAPLDESVVLVPLVKT